MATASWTRPRSGTCCSPSCGRTSGITITTTNYDYNKQIILMTMIITTIMLTTILLTLMLIISIIVVVILMLIIRPRENMVGVNMV